MTRKQIRKALFSEDWPSYSRTFIKNKTTEFLRHGGKIQALAPERDGPAVPHKSSRMPVYHSSTDQVVCIESSDLRNLNIVQGRQEGMT